MLTMPVTARFSETDALGHINNTVVPVWFEAAREPIFKIFNPELNLAEWNLIIAKIEVNYLAQIHYQGDIEIHTYISKIGTASFNVLQEVHQAGEKVAFGECVMVKFDYQHSKSMPLDENEKKQLSSLIKS